MQPRRVSSTDSNSTCRTQKVSTNSASVRKTRVVLAHLLGLHRDTSARPLGKSKNAPETQIVPDFSICMKFSLTNKSVGNKYVANNAVGSQVWPHPASTGPPPAANSRNPNSTRDRKCRRRRQIARGFNGTTDIFPSISRCTTLARRAERRAAATPTTTAGAHTVTWATLGSGSSVRPPLAGDAGLETGAPSLLCPRVTFAPFHAPFLPDDRH